MTTHTPGPWTIESDDFGTCDEDETMNPMLPVAILAADGTRVIQADEASPFWHGDQPEGDVAWANARLASAAPDLLEALEELADYFDGEAGYIIHESFQRKALAAIAKAKGGAP